MNTLNITKAVATGGGPGYQFPKATNLVNYGPYLLFGLLLLLWPLLQRWITFTDPTASYIDPCLWQLVLLSLICFLAITGVCWWLLQRFWMALGLPALGRMVFQFQTLQLWQQLSFYWLSFVSLLLAATGVMAAIC